MRGRGRELKGGDCSLHCNLHTPTPHSSIAIPHTTPLSPTPPPTPTHRLALPSPLFRDPNTPIYLLSTPISLPIFHPKILPTYLPSPPNYLSPQPTYLPTFHPYTPTYLPTFHPNTHPLLSSPQLSLTLLHLLHLSISSTSPFHHDPASTFALYFQLLILVVYSLCFFYIYF